MRGAGGSSQSIIIWLTAVSTPGHFALYSTSLISGVCVCVCVWECVCVCGSMCVGGGGGDLVEDGRVSLEHGLQQLQSQIQFHLQGAR